MSDIKPKGSLWHCKEEDYYVKVISYYNYRYWCDIIKKSTNSKITDELLNLITDFIPYTIPEKPEEPKSFERYLICNDELAFLFTATNCTDHNIFRIKITPDAKDLNDIVKVIERLQ